MDDVDDVDDDVSEERKGNGLLPAFLCQQIRQEPRAKRTVIGCDALIVV